MPFESTVHIDQALTNISIMYQQDDLVGDKVLPPFPVDKRSDRWFIYDRSHFFSTDDLIRPRGVASEVDYTLTTGFYNAERYGLKHLVTDAERRISDNPLRPEIDATEIVTARVQNNRERRQLALVTDPTQVTQNLGLSGTSQWSDYTNSTPLVNVRAARQQIRQSIAREPNTWTLGFDPEVVLADHPSIKDLVKYTHPENLSEGHLPLKIRGLNVQIAKAVINSQNQGQAQTTFNTMFGKNALVHYTNPAMGLRTLTFGLTFEPPDDTTGARGYSVRRWRYEDGAGDFLEVSTTAAYALIAPNAGYLFTTCVP